MMKKTIRIILIMLAINIMLVACSDAGPEPGFDVTGLWQGQGNNSAIEFKKYGDYEITFDPALSDGTTKFGGEFYKRVDNGTITFTVVMGRAAIEIIEVEATINSKNVLRFKLDGKTYRLEKADQ